MERAESWAEEFEGNKQAAKNPSISGRKLYLDDNDDYTTEEFYHDDKDENDDYTKEYMSYDINDDYSIHDLYPDINDEKLQMKIADKREFRELSNPYGLYSHQEFVRRFLSPHTPYKCLVLFHALGSGKSLACIATAVDYYLHDKRECMVVTKGDSGSKNFLKQIEKYRNSLPENVRNKWTKDIFFMRHYMALSNFLSSCSDEFIKDKYSKITIVLDEVHNVKSQSLAQDDAAGNSSSVFNQLERIMVNAEDIVVMMCTATPMTDSPEQLDSILSLCNTVYKRDSYEINGIVSFNSTIHDKPKVEFVGDNYRGTTVFMSFMVSHQKDVYMRQSAGYAIKDIYRSITHISLFCTPEGYYGKAITDNMMHKTRVSKSIQSRAPKAGAIKTSKDIVYTKYVPNSRLKKLLKGHSLRESSCKYFSLMNILREGMKTFVFVEEVVGSGILLLSSVLEEHGYTEYIGEPLDTMGPAKRYTLCVGTLELCPNMDDKIDGFNSPLNNTGEYIQVLLGSKVISESISLFNVRHFHSLTPHWNNSTIDQALGRVVRSGSHSVLDVESSVVKVYLHAAVARATDTGSSGEVAEHHGIDLNKINISITKQEKIRKKEALLERLSVDRFCYCGLDEVKSSDFRTLSAVYARYYIDELKNELSSNKAVIFDKNEASNGLLPIEALANRYSIPLIFCKELICHIIVNNIPINNMYLRAYSNKIYLVSDPSIPFISIPPYRSVLHPKRINEPVTISSITDKDITYEGMSSAGFLEKFRLYPVKEKIGLVEKCISDGKLHLLEKMHTLFVNNDSGNTIYHMLHYKNLESSYTSSKLAPKVLAGKTRLFVRGKWGFVDNIHEEYEVIDCYKKFIKNVKDQLRENEYYGLISSIDGKMRLRKGGKDNALDEDEDEDDNDKDNKMDKRRVLRGRTLQSIKKSELITIFEHLSESPIKQGMSISRLSNLIDYILVNTNKFIII